MKNYDPHLVGGHSDIGPVRQVNQDAFRLPDPGTPTNLGALYIVADGVGGQEHGEEAARIGVQVAYDSFYQARRQESPIQAALKFALNQANLAVYAEAQKRDGARMGCTMVAVVQHQGLLYVAHVGDARAYVLHDGRMRRMTRDDTWVQKQVEAGLLKAEDAAKHELRNVVTQVLGNKPEVDVHLGKPYTVAPDDMLLLCSDGLYDPVSDAQMEQILTSNPPQQAAEALIQAAVAGNATDNITAVVVQSGRISAARSGLPIPKWAPLAVVGVILLIALAAALPGLLRGGNENSAPDGATDLPTPLPTLPLVVQTVEGGDGLLATAVPAVPAVPAAPTSTIAPLPTETPTPTATPPPTFTPEPSPEPELSACVINLVFVWSDAQINRDACDQFALNQFARGTAVRYIDPITPLVTAGPDADCAPGNVFRKVRAVESGIEGWVLANALQLVEPGESCPP